VSKIDNPCGIIRTLWQDAKRLKNSRSKNYVAFWWKKGVVRARNDWNIFGAPDGSCQLRLICQILTHSRINPRRQWIQQKRADQRPSLSQ
jgi:hypothetical protein